MQESFFAEHGLNVNERLESESHVWRLELQDLREYYRFWIYESADGRRLSGTIS